MARARASCGASPAERAAAAGGSAAPHHPTGVRLRPALDPAAEDEDQEDDDEDAEAAGRVVAPAAGIAPGRKRADQREDQDDEKNGAERHGCPLSGRPRGAARGSML